MTLWLAWPAGCLQSFTMSKSKGSLLWQHFPKCCPRTHLSLNYLDSLFRNRPFSGPCNNALRRDSPETCHFSKLRGIIACTLEPEGCCLRHALFSLPSLCIFKFYWEVTFTEKTANAWISAKWICQPHRLFHEGNGSQARTPGGPSNPSLGTHTTEDPHSPDSWHHQLFGLFLNFI